MLLDIFTLLVLLGTVCLMASAGFAICWWNHRPDRLLLLSALTFAMGGIASGLLAARGHLPDLLTIDVANALFFVAMALGWNVFRFMNGRRILWAPLFVPAVVWLVLCRVPVFHDDTSLRTAGASVLLSMLFCGYCSEFLRIRGIPRAVRNVLLLSAGANVVVFAIRAVYSLATGRPDHMLHADIWLALTMFAPLIFASLLALGGLWLWQVRAVGTLQQEVAIDPLTGALSRRAFERTANLMLGGVRERNEKIALLLIDIDHFKAINDRLGHLAGDQVLRGFSDCVRWGLRKDDIFARYGGEEFIVLLQGADIEDARQVAEKLRARIADLAVDWRGEEVRVTASIGVASTHGRNTTLFDLIDRADRGLYGAKDAGRNRVAIAAA